MSAGSSRRLMRSPTSFGSTVAIAHSSGIALCRLVWHRLGLVSGTPHCRDKHGVWLNFQTLLYTSRERKAIGFPRASVSGKPSVLLNEGLSGNVVYVDEPAPAHTR